MGEPRRLCCIKWNLQRVYVGILAAESLAVVGSICFLLPSMIKGMQEYQASYVFLATIILYNQLVFYVVFQFLWLFSNFIAFVAIHFVVPYLLLPHFILSTVAFIIAAVLLGYTIDRLITWPSDITPGILFLVLLAIFLILQMYTSSVKLRCFRLLVKRKKAVQGTCEVKPAVADCNQESSFSRRSTVIITDDFYEPPPKI